MQESSKVYKDQCAFCFKTPEMNGGLLICAVHKFAFCSEHVKIHNDVDKCKKFVHFIRLRRSLEKKDEGTDTSDQPEKKITKLAIGVEGGCQIEPKFEFCDSWTVVENYPDLSEKNVPEDDEQIQSIISAESAYRMRELEALAGTWDGSELIETKHKSLLQLPFVGKIPTKGWRCQFEGGCDKTENLWMNLTDGKIFCGRKNFDGSGGNNHAIEHYQRTKYPLAVNLGTITPQTADIYSYDEDEMVLDPNLGQHLHHFGINMMEMEKTEKTMLEKELDLNKTWEYASIQEDGRNLIPAYGLGFLGIHNLGNSCYMNSLLQSFGQMPEVVKPLVDKVDAIFRACRQNPYEDLWVQTAKMFSALVSEDYSASPEEVEKVEGFEAPESGVRPYDFRYVVGRGNAEFSSKKQQDVEEYMRFLSEKFQRCLADLHAIAPNVDPLLPTQYLANVVEDGGKTTYFNVDCMFDVDFDVKPRTTVGEDVHRPTVNLLRRLKEIIENPLSVKTGRIVRFATFPRYLLIKVNRHAVTDDWQLKKLDYSCEIDDSMDLNFMRGPMPTVNDTVHVDKSQASKRSATPPHAIVQPVNAEHLSILMSMGFSEVACRKALKSTSGSDMNAALDWIMNRLGDPGLDAPEEASHSGNAPSSGVDAQLMSTLIDSGFPEARAKYALKKSKNNLEAAFNYLLDGGGESGGEEEVQRPATPPSQVDIINKLKNCDGKGVYQLLGVISHIGTSTKTGHYVYHGLKEKNRWAIFNDEKVAWSESPPIGFGYVYVFKRTE